jgi:hypothetical protein
VLWIPAIAAGIFAKILPLWSGEEGSALFGSVLAMAPGIALVGGSAGLDDCSVRRRTILSECPQWTCAGASTEQLLDFSLFRGEKRA